jgi:methionine synthase II (cobalamin-independent)
VIPWKPADATGVGSMPGTSAREAARIVAGELPGFLHVVELPQRGPGADMIGRTGGMLARVSSGLGLETTPDGWRLAGGVGRQMRRAWSFLGEDLDALEETAQGYGGPVKCQVTGPWTMAASVELPSGERALKDAGATREIAEALGEAIREQVADLRRRVPMAAAVLVQLDEPALPTVLAGRIGTASGLSSYAPVDEQVAGRVLAAVMDTVRDVEAMPGVHCCAGEVPFRLLTSSGAEFLSVDITRLDAEGDEGIGQAWESGVGILAGTVPSSGLGRMGDARASAPLRDLMSRVGLSDETALSRLAVTPTCGLAGASPNWSREALTACRAVGRVVRNDEERTTEDEPDA